MARARGCDLRAVLAGATICWIFAGAVAVAQESAEVAEDLGNSYSLARRATSQGSIIETLLFGGQAIVTEIMTPAPDTGATDRTTGAVQAAPGGANAARGDTANLPLGAAPGFGGTLLTGEISDGYLILHRTRATGPVTHEIFRDGREVGSVTEVGSPVGVGRSPGAFAFESIGDRFVVHLTQPDGTRIRATTEHGQFSGQVVERTAAVASPPRSAAKPPSQPPLEPMKPSIGRPPESQRLAGPQEPAGRIMVEEPASQIAPVAPEPVPLPRAFPKPQLRPTIAATPVQTTSPSLLGNDRSTPAARPKPAVASVNAPPPAAVAARPTAPAPKTIPPAKPKPALASASPPPPAAAAARPVASAPKTEQPSRPKSAVANIPRQSPAATAAKPITPASTTAASAAKPKPTPATANARPSQAAAAKPVTPAAKLLRSPPPGTSSQ